METFSHMVLVYAFVLKLCCPAVCVPVGLGTSTAKEAKEYFCDMLRHRIPFKYCGPEDDASIILVITI